MKNMSGCILSKVSIRISRRARSLVPTARMAVLALILAAACAAPDAFSPQNPLRDSYPVKELWIVEGMSEAVSVVNLDRWRQGLSPHTISPLFLSSRIPNSITFHEGKGYIVNSGANSITVFDVKNPNTRHEIFLFPNANPWEIAFVRHGGVLRGLITCTVNNSLAVVRIEESSGWLERIIPLTHKSPEGIVSDGHYAWVAMSGWFQTGPWSVDYNPGYLSILDTSSEDINEWQETEHCAVAKNPQALALDSARGLVYVLSSGIYDWASGGLAENGALTVFDAENFDTKNEIVLTNMAQALVLDRAGGRLYLGGSGFIACYNADTLERIPLQSLADESPGIALYGPGLALNEADGILFAADFDNNRVLAFDVEADLFIGELSCGDGPQALAYIQLQ